MEDTAEAAVAEAGDTVAEVEDTVAEVAEEEALAAGGEGDMVAGEERSAQARAGRQVPTRNSLPSSWEFTTRAMVILHECCLIQLLTLSIGFYKDLS